MDRILRHGRPVLRGLVGGVGTGASRTAVRHIRAATSRTFTMPANNNNNNQSSGTGSSASTSSAATPPRRPKPSEVYKDDLPPIAGTTTISFDRSRLFQHVTSSSSSSSSSSSRNSSSNINSGGCGVPQEKESETEMIRHLKMKIDVRGPLSIAEYMQECLFHPDWGYYQRSQVFGKSGDFTTSPEISQLFGESIGVWCVDMWQRMGKPPRIRIVELGPGNGTLIDDILHTTAQFGEFSRALSVHLVEASSLLGTRQRVRLGGENAPAIPDESGNPPPPSSTPSTSTQKQAHSEIRNSWATYITDRGENASVQPPVASVRSHWGGVPIYWYSQISALPPPEDTVPTLYIAQEFFDAIPVYQFQYASKGWCERVVDVDRTAESPHHFRYVLSPGPTFASRTFLQLPQFEDFVKFPKQDDCIEVCPVALSIIQDVASRLLVSGGALLIIDYGENHTMSDTIQAIKDHKFGHMFSKPGEQDLSAYVDFSAIARTIRDIPQLSCFGATTQRDLLFELGIDARLVSLLRHCTNEEQCSNLISGYTRLTDEKEMGVRYKAMCIQYAAPYKLSGQTIADPTGFAHVS